MTIIWKQYYGIVSLFYKAIYLWIVVIEFYKNAVLRKPSYLGQLLC